MSRIGKKPIEVPAGVEIELAGNMFRAKGPKGELSKALPAEVVIKKEDNLILVERPTDNPRHRSLHGLTRTLIANVVQGVSQGFEKNLEIVGVGYRAVKKGNDLEIQVGYSLPVVVPKAEGIEFEVPTPTKITIRGADKELVGEVAAKIRAVRKPEPYKGKGIKYAGEHIRRKAGKTAK
jgi:large subunit ribosomal protein L6